MPASLTRFDESGRSAFLYTTCQVGAENALKAELEHRWPAFRFAYSRPGFLTFKLPDGHAFADDLDLKSVFAREYGFSLGKIEGGELAERQAIVLGCLAEGDFSRLHVWARDEHEPTPRSEITRSDEVLALEQELYQRWREAGTEQTIAGTETILEDGNRIPGPGAGERRHVVDRLASPWRRALAVAGRDQPDRTA